VAGALGKLVALLGSEPGLAWSTCTARLRRTLAPPTGMIEGTVWGGVRFRFPCDWDPHVQLMVHGGYEAFTVRALRRCLRPGDTFIDVGANIGYLSAVAAGIVGPSGAVHAFEPVPQYFANVQWLAEHNPNHTIHAVNQAAGAEAGTASIDVSTDNLGWNTMVGGLMAEGEKGEPVDVAVVRLTDYLAEALAPGRAVQLIKIDVEGFEWPALVGLAPWLRAQSPRPPLLLEVAPSAYPAVGTTLAEFAALLADLGYAAEDLIAGRPVDVAALTVTDTLLLRPRT
jgi:FkbM family methyltransferase